MNKTELIATVAKEAKVTKKDAAAVIDAFIDVVGKTIKKGDKVQLIGFGTFETSKRSARKGHNPATGETIKIAASKLPRFKAGRALKDLVNGAKKKK